MSMYSLLTILGSGVVTWLPIFVAVLTRNSMWVVIAGMSCMALIRYFII